MSGRHGFLIALEGIDGAGKSEQARRLATWLRALRGPSSVVLTQEPTDSDWGLLARSWLQHNDPSEALLEAFIADRTHHVWELLRPALELGCTVVCDRYIASTLAYQAAEGFGRDELARRVRQGSPPEPDLTLWLRLPVDQALARIPEGNRDRFERADLLARVDEEYSRLGLTELDASQDPDAVEASIAELVWAVLFRERSGQPPWAGVVDARPAIAGVGARVGAASGTEELVPRQGPMEVWWGGGGD